MVRRASWLLAGLLLLAPQSDALGQALGDGPSPLALHVPRAAENPAAAPLRSAVIPGWGQLHQGKRRGWAYLAVEALAWTYFAERTLAGRGLRSDYQDLAWSAARIQGASRTDGDFAYYEFLSKWTRSGAFDADAAAPGIQPESDPNSFNGSIWALAREIYVPPGASPSVDDPAYQQALAYYLSRAYGPEYLWDWSQRLDAKQEFNDLIRDSDSRFRQATTALGVIIANHLISATDAYLSGRKGLEESPMRVWAEPTPAGPRLGAFVRIGVP